MRFRLYRGVSAWLPHRISGTGGCYLLVYTYSVGDRFGFTAEGGDAARNPIVASSPGQQMNWGK